MTATVINMATARREVKPARHTYEHGGQRYTCSFDPSAPPGEQWVWFVDYVTTYKFVGNGPTLEAVSKEARRKIHKLNKWYQEMDEHDLSKS